MDYLQEGINLRAMGQKDPLVEWQREGFEMFGMMMKGIAQDFVRTSCTSRSPSSSRARRRSAPTSQRGNGRRRRAVQNVQYSAPDDPARAAAAAWRPPPGQVAAEGGPSGAPAPWPSSRPR